VNIKALMHLTRHALPHLMRQPRSAVVNISSIAGKMGFAGGGAYCASKHAVMGFSEAVFEDVREHGVKVCAICPGYVRTELISARGGLDAAKMLQPEDVADAVLYVARCADTACPTEIVLRPQRTPYR
jgi:NADP-dependent 3-hydroxy acid dehydrogenase YdfG